MVTTFVTRPDPIRPMRRRSRQEIVSGTTRIVDRPELVPMMGAARTAGRPRSLRALPRLHFLVCALAAMGTAASACIIPASHAYSPPAVIAPMGSLGPVEQGVVRVEAGAYSRDEEEDASVSGVVAHVRSGLMSGVELNFAARGGWLNSYGRVSPDSTQVAGRTGLRVSPTLLVNNVALDLGFGVGSHEGGSYVAPDVALSVGHASPYVSIWMRFETFRSVPVVARQQHVIVGSEPVGLFGDSAVWGMQLPNVSHAYMARTGFEITLLTTGRVRPSIYFSSAVGQVNDREGASGGSPILHSTGVIEASIGMSFSIHPREQVDAVALETPPGPASSGPVLPDRSAPDISN